MEGKIMYRMDYEKAIEVMVWLANKYPNIDIYHVSKVLYYAEKMHLNKYGRPIIGATYIRMPFGQVPSEIRDLIIQNAWTIEPDNLKNFSESIKVNKDPYDKLNALRAAHLEYFSDTDIECLEISLKEYGSLSFEELKNLCHKEKTWNDTEENAPIDYLLMIDDESDYKEETLNNVRFTSQYVRFS